MLSWDALNASAFMPGGQITAAFNDIAKPDLRSAAEYVCGLPYGRNSDPREPLIVLSERRGTCSTKHALLRRLAIEQGFELALVLGIYEMTEDNTPGIGPVLQRHSLSSLPEAHCYLRTGERRIDLTRALGSRRSAQPIGNFLHEEEITPEQITDYKIGVHKKFLKKWLASHPEMHGFSLEELWRIREECIARLGHNSVIRSLEESGRT